MAESRKLGEIFIDVKLNGPSKKDLDDVKKAATSAQEQIAKGQEKIQGQSVQKKRKTVAELVKLDNEKMNKIIKNERMILDRIEKELQEEANLKKRTLNNEIKLRNEHLNKLAKISQEEVNLKKRTLNNEIKLYQEHYKKVDALSIKNVKEQEKIQRDILASKKALNQQKLKEIELQKATAASYKNADLIAKKYQESLKAGIAPQKAWAEANGKVLVSQSHINESFMKGTPVVKSYLSRVKDLTAGVLAAAPGFAIATAAVGAFYSALNLLKNQFTGGLKSIEDMNLRIAQMTGFIVTFSKKAKEGDVAGAYKEALPYARRLVEVVEVLDAKSLATGEQLNQMVAAFIKYGIALEPTNKKQLDSVVDISNALVTLIGEQDKRKQIEQEIRAIGTGQVKTESVLISLLQKIDPEIKSHLKIWQQQRTTLENIGGLLKGMASVTELLQVTWATVGSTMETINNKILRGALETTYRRLMDLAMRLNNALMDSEGNLTPLARSLQRVVADIGKGISKITELLFMLVPKTAESVEMLYRMVKVIGNGGLAYLGYKAINSLLGQTILLQEAWGVSIYKSEKAVKSLFKTMQWGFGLLFAWTAGKEIGTWLYNNFAPVREFSVEMIDLFFNIKSGMSQTAEELGVFLEDLFAIKFLNTIKKAIGEIYKQIGEWMQKLNAIPSWVPWGEDLKNKIEEVSKKYVDFGMAIKNSTKEAIDADAKYKEIQSRYSEQNKIHKETIELLKEELKAQSALNKEAIKAPELATQADLDAIKEIENAKDKLETYIKTIEKEIVVLEAGAEAGLMYRIIHGDIGETLKKAGKYTEEYTEKMFNLAKRYAEAKENVRIQKEEEKERNKVLKDFESISKRSLSELEKIHDEYRRGIEITEKYLEQKLKEGPIQEEIYQQVKKTRRQLEQTRDKSLREYAEKNDKYAKKIKDLWDRAYKSIEDSLTDWIMGSDNAFDSLLDSFKRMLAEMVASWILNVARMNGVQPSLSLATSGTVGGGGVGGLASVAKSFSGLGSSLKGFSLIGGINAAGTALQGGTLSNIASAAGLSSLASYFAPGVTAPLAPSLAPGVAGPLAEGAGGYGSVAGAGFGAIGAGLTAGIGTFLISGLMNQDWEKAAKQGLGSASGAALGTAILPGIGTVVGAILGGIGGSFLGGSKDSGPPRRIARLASDIGFDEKGTFQYDISNYAPELQGPMSKAVTQLQELSSGLIGNLPDVLQKKTLEYLTNTIENFGEGYFKGKKYDQVANNWVTEMYNRVYAAIQMAVDKAFADIKTDKALDLSKKFSGLADFAKISEIFSRTANFDQFQEVATGITDFLTTIDSILNPGKYTELVMSIQEVNKGFEESKQLSDALGISLTDFNKAWSTSLSNTVLGTESVFTDQSFIRAIEGFNIVLRDFNSENRIVSVAGADFEDEAKKINDIFSNFSLKISNTSFGADAVELQTTLELLDKTTSDITDELLSLYKLLSQEVGSKISPNQYPELLTTGLTDAQFREIAGGIAPELFSQVTSVEQLLPTVSNFRKSLIDNFFDPITSAANDLGKTDLQKSLAPINDFFNKWKETLLFFKDEMGGDLFNQITNNLNLVAQAQVQELIDGYITPITETFNDFWRNISISDLAPVQSREGVENIFSDLLGKAETGGIGDINKLLSFVQSDYLPFMKAFTGDVEGQGYASIWDNLFNPETGKISSLETNLGAVTIDNATAIGEAVANALAPYLDANQNIVIKIGEQEFGAAIITQINSNPEVNEALRYTQPIALPSY